MTRGRLIRLACLPLMAFLWLLCLAWSVLGFFPVIGSTMAWSFVRGRHGYGPFTPRAISTPPPRAIRC